MGLRRRLREAIRRHGHTASRRIPGQHRDRRRSRNRTRWRSMATAISSSHGRARRKTATPRGLRSSLRRHRRRSGRRVPGQLLHAGTGAHSSPRHRRGRRLRHHLDPIRRRRRRCVCATLQGAEGLRHRRQRQRPEPLTDGLLFLRYAFGFRGTTSIAGACRRQLRSLHSGPDRKLHCRIERLQQDHGPPPRFRSTPTPRAVRAIRRLPPTPTATSSSPGTAVMTATATASSRAGSIPPACQEPVEFQVNTYVTGDQ